MTIGDKAPSQALPLPPSDDILQLAKEEFAVSRNPQELFFNQAGLDLNQTHKFTETALHGADDGELFLEYTLSEAFSFDDNRRRLSSNENASDSVYSKNNSPSSAPCSAVSVNLWVWFKSRPA